MIFASVITYELSKRLGKEQAKAEFSRQVNRVLDPSENERAAELPAARMVRRLRRHSEVAILHDAGGTSIGHARSRAFSLAVQSGCDLWISIDDDTEASDDTTAHLLSALDPATPQIVIVPSWLRQDDPCVNITLDPAAPLERVTKTGARLRRALYGGFGIVAVTRAALDELARECAELCFLDDDGKVRLGLFVEFIREGWWYREDYAFFSRVPPHVRIEALLSGVTNHDGKKLRLETVEQQRMIPRPQALTAPHDTEPPPPLLS